MPGCYKCGESSPVTVSPFMKQWGFFQLWWNDYLEDRDVLHSESFVSTSQCFFLASSFRTSTGAGWSRPRSCTASCLCADSWLQPHAVCPITSWFGHVDCQGCGASSRYMKLALFYGLWPPCAFNTASTLYGRDVARTASPWGSSHPQGQHPCPGLGLQLQRRCGPCEGPSGPAAEGKGRPGLAAAGPSGTFVMYRRVRVCILSRFLLLINAVHSLRRPCSERGLWSCDVIIGRRAALALLEPCAGPPPHVGARREGRGEAGRRGRWAWFAGRARRLSSPGSPGPSGAWRDGREAGVGLPGPARQVRAGVGGARVPRRGSLSEGGIREVGTGQACAGPSWGAWGLRCKGRGFPSPREGEGNILPPSLRSLSHRCCENDHGPGRSGGGGRHGSPRLLLVCLHSQGWGGAPGRVLQVAFLLEGLRRFFSLMRFAALGVPWEGIVPCWFFLRVLPWGGQAVISAFLHL